MNLIYCYDAYCGWCYGFSPVIKQIEQHYQNRLTCEILSGGMILPEIPRSIQVIAPVIQESYKMVEDHTGIEFGNDFLWHVFHSEESDWFPNSEKPAIALCIVKDLAPGRGIEFAGDIQYGLNYEGRDLTDDEAYRHLLPKYNIDADEFYHLLHTQEYKDKAYHEFELVKKLRVESFPQVLIQVSSLKFHLISKGFLPFTELKNRIDLVLSEMGN